MRGAVLPQRLRDAPKPPSAAHTLPSSESRNHGQFCSTADHRDTFRRLVISLPTKDRAVV